MTDAEIVQGLKEGRREAFESLYEFYGSALLGHISRLFSSREIAEEIFQETLLTAVKKISLFKQKKDERSSLKAWLFRIGTNLSIDYIRREKRGKEIIFENLEEEKQYSMEENYSEMEESKKVKELIDKLPVTQRMFFSLRVIEEMSYMEISRICGCSIESVKQGLFRARKNMKNLLIEEGMA